LGEIERSNYSFDKWPHISLPLILFEAEENMTTKMTFDEIKSIVEKRGFILLREYSEKITIRNRRKIEIQDKIGYKYSVNLDNFIGERKTKGARPIEGKNPYNLENIALWLKVNKKKFLFTENTKYIDCHSKLELYCEKCCDIFYIKWNDLQTGYGCGVCAGQQVGNNHSLKKLRPDIAKSLDPDNHIDGNELTVGSNKKVSWICNFNHKYKTTVYARTKRNEGCPICYKSKGESRILNFLENKSIKRFHCVYNRRGIYTSICLWKSKSKWRIAYDAKFTTIYLISNSNYFRRI